MNLGLVCWLFFKPGLWIFPNECVCLDLLRHVNRNLMMFVYKILDILILDIVRFSNQWIVDILPWKDRFLWFLCEQYMRYSLFDCGFIIISLDLSTEILIKLSEIEEIE